MMEKSIQGNELGWKSAHWVLPIRIGHRRLHDEAAFSCARLIGDRNTIPHE